MHSIVMTFREAVIKVEIANSGAAMDTLIDQDGYKRVLREKTETFHQQQIRINLFDSLVSS